MPLRRVAYSYLLCGLSFISCAVHKAPLEEEEISAICHGALQVSTTSPLCCLAARDHCAWDLWLLDDVMQCSDIAWICGLPTEFWLNSAANPALVLIQWLTTE